MITPPRRRRPLLASPAAAVHSTLLRAALPSTLALAAATATGAAAEPVGLGMRPIDGDRHVGLDVAYAGATGASAGTAALSARIPLGAASWGEARAGVMVGEVAGSTAAALTNPTVGAGYRLSPRTALAAALGLPAASDSGDGGALAAALAELHAVAPATLSPGASHLAVGVDHLRRGARTFVHARAGLVWIARPDAADLPLVHADLGGGIALTRRVHVASSLFTTAYILADTAGDDFVHAVALGATVTLPGVDLALRGELPLDAAGRDRDLFTIALAARAAL